MGSLDLFLGDGSKLASLTVEGPDPASSDRLESYVYWENAYLGTVEINGNIELHSISSAVNTLNNVATVPEDIIEHFLLCNTRVYTAGSTGYADGAVNEQKQNGKGSSTLKRNCALIISFASCLRY